VLLRNLGILETSSFSLKFFECFMKRRSEWGSSFPQPWLWACTGWRGIVGQWTPGVACWDKPGPRSPHGVPSPESVFEVSGTAHTAWPSAPTGASQHPVIPADGYAGPPVPPLCHIHPNTVTRQGFHQLTTLAGTWLQPSSSRATPSVLFTVFSSIRAQPSNTSMQQTVQ